VLHWQPHDVPILVAARLFKPLGNRPPNSVKFFATPEVLGLVKDRAWLAKVTNALNQHWHKKKMPPNARLRSMVMAPPCGNWKQRAGDWWGMVVAELILTLVCEPKCSYEVK
jgi:hypothetical protein